MFYFFTMNVILSLCSPIIWIKSANIHYSLKKLASSSFSLSIPTLKFNASK